MTLKLTDRDKKILVVLVAILLLAGVGYGIIFPMFTKGQALKTQVSKEQTKKEENEQKILMLPTLEKSNEELSTNISKAQAEFYPLMKSMEIDQMLTETALANGISVKSLDITMPAEGEYASLLNYASVLLPDSKDTKETEAKERTYSGIYVAEAQLTMSGSRDMLQSVLDSYVSQEPKARVTKFVWQQQSGSTEYSLGITVEIYMYQDTQQYIEAQQQAKESTTEE